ncbi:hypothetical protein COY07_00570 [Candidatus Peregrinibacteria bacterium CG_4_10_14_0_2_um_filter_43_11]|nr:MAG: hypothetical protein COY07_00570 [Candidatus Peregrinibacteria bacterium CG_4_10_14_0_2_um_filter_43_11]
MSRQTDFHNKVEKYLNGVQVDNKKHWMKLVDMIVKLAKHGEELIQIDSDSYKPLHVGNRGAKEMNLIIIQLKIKRKKYRIHTALTKNYLYLLHAFDKQGNKTPSKELGVTINRAKTIVNF